MSQKKHDYSAWIEVDMKAVRSNFRAIKKLTKEREVEQRLAQKLPIGTLRTPQILSIVKADAYGHGMLPVAEELIKQGTDFLGVSELSEGVTLRQNGIKKPVLVLEPPLPSSVKHLVDFDLIGTVCTASMAAALNTYARSVNKKANVHIMVDTGMGRMGVLYDEAMDFIKKIMRLPYLSVKGVYTHFPLADTDPDFTRRQIDDMHRLVNDLDRQGLVIPYAHGANSMGIAGYKTRVCNVVRPGLMLYGLYPSKASEKLVKLEPAMTVKARVIFVKTVVKGMGISYGHTFVAKRRMTVATLPIGYNDGYMRVFSNKAHVLIGGKRCRILGRVTMDQVVVDVSHVDAVRPGTEAVIIGRQKKECVSADELAQHAGTINYEIVCSLGNRLPRVYKSV